MSSDVSLMAAVICINNILPHITGQMAHSSVTVTLPLFLFALARSRKAPVGFVVPVCPSVCIYQFGSQRTDFIEIWYWRHIKTYPENQNLLKLGQKYQTLHVKT